MIYVDDLNRRVELKESPQRIISLVPSVTELLFDLGLSEHIVGRTSYCIYPEHKIINVASVGGPKDFDLKKLRALKPDLIITVKEENDKELVLEAMQICPVLVYDIVDIASALNMIREIGLLTDTQKRASSILNQIQLKKERLEKRNQEYKTACYLIWNVPMMTVNQQTFISEMMRLAGFDNAFSNKTEHYPVLLEEDISLSEIEYILLSSEPFKFTEKHRKSYQNRFPRSKVILVDGEMFSWYGSRMLKALDYFLQSF